MSVTIIDNGTGRGVGVTADGTGEVTRPYTVIGATSEEQAVVELNNYLIVTMGDPPLIGALVLDRIGGDESEQDVWEMSATWKTFARRQQPATGEIQFNFELSLEPQRVKVPVGEIVVYSNAERPWKPELLNDLGDGTEPEGVEVFEHIYEESETHYVKTEYLTIAYRQLLKTLVGRVNTTTFRGNQPGEVLLRGVSGSRRGANDTEMTFRWSVKENQTAFKIGAIENISKKGWQYLWPRYGTVKPDSDAPAYQGVTHVCVADVFYSGNINLIFDALNPGA